jgi:hypothetical protein
LVAWTVRRYDRTTLPDEFVRRLASKPRQRLRKLQRKGADDLVAIYIAMSTKRELAATVDYHIRIQLVLTDAAWADLDVRTQIEQTVFDPIVNVFKAANGIVVDDERLLGASDFSIAEFPLFEPFDFDLDLSYSDDPPAMVPPRSAQG